MEKLRYIPIGMYKFLFLRSKNSLKLFCQQHYHQGNLKKCLCCVSGGKLAPAVPHPPDLSGLHGQGAERQVQVRDVRQDRPTGHVPGERRDRRISTYVVFDVCDFHSMFQAIALVDIVKKFNWTYVSTIASEGSYGKLLV